MTNYYDNVHKLRMEPWWCDSMCCAYIAQNYNLQCLFVKRAIDMDTDVAKNLHNAELNIYYALQKYSLPLKFITFFWIKKEVKKECATGVAQ